MTFNQQNVLPKGTLLKSGAHEYVISKVLGAGGFGITYLVKGRRGNIPVDMAVKEHFMASVCERDATGTQVVYSKPVAQQVEGALKDFITEANRLNSLDIKSPNIISIDEVFRANNTAYYVMEYVDGPSLGKIVRDNKGKPFSEQEALAIIRPILEAVQNLHNAHITHLDIKPDNILLDYDEITEKQRPVLIDFGLSKHYDEKGAPTSTINISGCSEGYAPMEQYVGIRSFTPQADVYALAATLYFMLTGQNPPMAANVKGEELRAALSGKCSPEVADAIIRAMHYQLDGRTQSVNDFLRRLFPASPTPTIATAIVEPVVSTTTTQSSSTRIESTPPTPATSHTTPPPPHTPLPPTPSSPVIPNAVHHDEERKRNQKNWIIAAIVILLVVALGVISYIINKATEEIANTDSTEQIVEQKSSEGDVLQEKTTSNSQESDEDYIARMTNEAENGNTEAMFDLYGHYKRGEKGLETSETKALTWLKKAANSGHGHAQCELACAYYLGDMVPKSDSQYVKWIKIAADNNDSSAQSQLADLYKEGKYGIKKDISQFIYWEKRAVDNNFSPSAFSLGIYYDDIDRDEAIKWYIKALDMHWAEHHDIDTTVDEYLRKLGVVYDPSTKKIISNQIIEQ